MNVVVVFCFAVVTMTLVDCGTVPVPSLVRTPSFDSAIIKSDRLGGNFAYSTVEGHAYAAINPIVQKVVEPVAVSYTAHQVPLGYATVPLGRIAHVAPGLIV